MKATQKVIRNFNARTILAGLMCACGLTVLATVTVYAAETEKTPGSGYVNPEAIPERPRAEDIKPVYRPPTVDTLATIRSRGILRVGVAEVPPMVMHDKDGNLVGFSIDIARQLADDMGVMVNFVPTAWSQIIPDLINNNSDVIVTGLWVTPTRALVVNYSDATADEGIYMIANKALAEGKTRPEDYNQPDVNIAVYEGTIQEQVARKVFPQANIVYVRGDQSELQPVLEGKATGVLIATFAPRVIVQTFPDKLSLGLEKPVQSTSSAMAVRKGDSDFVNYLNSWLTFQRDIGWLEERSRYWTENIDWMQ